MTRRPDQKPKAIPELDKQGRPIVTLDETGERVFKKAAKGKEPEPRKSAGPGMTLKSRPETPAEFGERCYAVMMADPYRYFCRRDIPRLKADLEEYRYELWQQQKLLSERYNNGYWFRDTGACFKWNKPCAYFDICTDGIEVSPDMEFAPMGFEFKRAHSELSIGKEVEEG